MDTSTTTFCRFSPLKSPKKKQKNLFKFEQQDMLSETESLASVVTSDIHKLAKSVTNKLKSSADVGMLSSDDDLFVSQSKKVSSPVKSAKKRPISDSESDSSSESEADTKKSPNHKKQKEIVSPKKRSRYESEVKSEQKLKSNLTSSQKSGKKNNLHDISDSSDDSSSSETDSSKRSSVLAHDSSKRRRGSTSSENSRSSIEGRKGRSVSRSGDESDSGTDRSSDSDKSDSLLQSKRMKTTPTKKGTDTDKDSLSENGKLRYEIPDNFEIGTSINYLSKSDIQGKQLWLITAPDDFDISLLHGQKIKLAGTSFITNENLETEKQFEVVGRPFTSKMSNYSSASSHAPGSEDFVLGSPLSGQLQVMDWIPCMPKIELIIPHHEKHRVPDDLKPTFVPFGSESPGRDVETDDLVSQKEKHKKKKKKKDKKKK